MALNPRCGRVRTAKHAPRDRFYLLERRHGLAISGLAPTAPFLVVVGQWGGAGGAVCEDHFGFLRRLRLTR